MVFKEIGTSIKKKRTNVQSRTNINIYILISCVQESPNEITKLHLGVEKRKEYDPWNTATASLIYSEERSKYGKDMNNKKKKNNELLKRRKQEDRTIQEGDQNDKMQGQIFKEKKKKI